MKCVCDVSGPNCVAPPSVPDEAGDTPRPFVESITTGGSGSTEELVVTTLPSLFEQLRDSCVESITLPRLGYLVRCELPLGDCEIDDEIGMRKFGSSRADFTRLSERRVGLTCGIGLDQPRQVPNSHVFA